MTRAYQITMHARSLRRWFPAAEARRRAAHYIDSCAAWVWPEPLQLELFV